VQKAVNIDEQEKESKKLAIIDLAKLAEAKYIIGIPSCPLIGSSTSGKPRVRRNSPLWFFGFVIGRMLNIKNTFNIIRQGQNPFTLPVREVSDQDLVTNGQVDHFIVQTNETSSIIQIAAGKGNYSPATEGMSLWGLLLGLVPIAIVGGLSHFKTGSSTVAQRAWTMSWLASGVIAGLMLGGSMDLADKKHIKQHTTTNGMIGILFIFGATAIGGFVVVGEMVKQYGSCISLS